jgi:hypothetical protein
MKTKRRILFLLSAIAIIATNLLLPAAFSSCDRGDDCVHQYITDTLWIPPEDTTLIILNGYERMRYQVTIDSQIVDTVEFKGRGISRSFTKFYDEGVCEDYTHNLEKQSFTYYNTGPDYNWRDLEFEMYVYHTKNTHFRVNFRKETFIGLIGSLTLSWYAGRIGEITFNNNFYRDVVLFSEGNVTNLTDKDPKLYYDIRHGIVRIERNENEIWDLIP